MASEEERAKILAEYMKEADKGNGDDEPEWNGGDSDSDDDDEEEFDDDQSDNDGKPPHEENYVVLQGSLVINDEGRLVFSGTWCMKKDLLDNGGISKEHKDSSDGKMKRTKFKLKSRQVLSAKKFDLRDPLLPDQKPRTLLFDGFFHTDATDAIEPYRKIKERNVEITFSRGASSKNTEDSKTFLVKGQGTNDFGIFSIEGIYRPVSPFSLTVSKRYGSNPVDDDYDSEDIEGDEGDAADMGELMGLHEEANLSVEELRKRYYGGDSGEAGNDDDAPVASAKKQKYEDDDDECGF
jgi:hypothetical protein